MNRGPRFPSPQFIFNPQNRNRNRNPSHNPNPNPSYNLAPSHNQLNSSNSDVVGTLLALDELLKFSQSTLDRFESVVPGILDSEMAESVSGNVLAPCGSNPNHLMRPEDLFLHSLRCPLRLDVREKELLQELRYPKMLKSEDELMRENKFVQKLEDPNAEVLFSLDEYMDFDTNFFYKDCPGVVRVSGGDNKDKMFSLPGVLAVECANFGVESCGRIEGLSRGCVMLLPSEGWAVRCEIERWSDYPSTYSYSILKLFLGLEFVNKFDSLTWIITNSSRFGIVIDVAMRDHIFVLFRLCLKAAKREAARFSELMLRANADSCSNGTSVKGDACVKCPVLLDAFRWLASQLSILYSLGCAKSLIIDMLKNLLLDVASKLSLWPVDQSLVDASASKLERVQLDAISITDHKAKADEDNDHVGAAIASLYERSLLEERISTLRNPRRLPAYERVNEHACWSTIAEEERKNRPNYRPLLEHDGLPSQLPNDQGTSGRAKTREELLAEERDYKRRRMSYRGKKLKRTTKEVLRDIIEEHMEAIREAGGIGCSVKGEGKVTVSDPVAGRGFSGGDGSRLDISNAYDTRRDQLHGHDKQLPADYDVKRKELMSSSERFYEQRKGDSHRHGKDLEDRRKMKREGYYSKYPSSRSPDMGRSNGSHRQGRSYSRGSSNELRSHRREHNINEGVAENRHYRKETLSSTTSEYHDSRHCAATSRSGSVSSIRRDGQVFETSDRQKKKKHENGRSGSSTRDDYSDRYDPSRSQDADDEFLSDSKV
ncbi:U11/U12 small nuclear ribonucleoprotein 48 kDa protein-like protein [Drosera capensis]